MSGERTRARAVLSGLALLSGAFYLAEARSDAPAHRRYGHWRSGRIGGGGFLQQAVWAPADPRRMYLTSDVGGIYRSDDGGRTWHMLHGALPADASSYSIRGVAVDPRNKDRVLFAADSGVWLSENAGRSFTRVLETHWAGNGNNRADGRILIFHPRDSRTVFAAALKDGFHVSRDRGRTWKRTGPDDVNPVEIWVDVRDPKRIWLCCRPWRDCWVDGGCNLVGGLFLSEDGGFHWEKISDEALFELRQDPNDAGVLIGLVREKRVVRSTDNGRTWEPFARGLAPYEKGGAREDGIYTAIDTGPDFTVLGGHGGNFYRLDRGATSWRKVFGRDAEKVDEGDWWGALERTYPHFGSALGWVAVNPHDPNHWAFTDWYALYQSRDAGKTWKLTIDGVEMTVVHVVTQDPGDPDLVHVGVADVGYFRSYDGGETFEQNQEGISNNVKHISVCHSRPERVYAVGPQRWEWHANQAFASRDGGRTWKRSPMTGLPGMESRRCNTIAAHPKRPDEVYLVLNGKIAPNDGGVWKSADAGESWTWMGRGLPEVDWLFRTDIWVAGPELAVSGDGSMVAGSDDRNRLFRFDPKLDIWQEVSLGGAGGGVNAVAADPLAPGRFYVAMKEGGLFRSDDGGASWRNVVGTYVSYVAVDGRKKGRIAAVSNDRVFLSGDSGRTWRDLGGPPYRHMRNVACFAGDRLIVGTGGSGVFWTRAAGLRGRAQKLADGRAFGRQRPVSRAAPHIRSLLKNGNMSAGTDTPRDWWLSDWKTGSLLLKRDVTVFRSAPASLRLETRGQASGFAQQRLDPVPQGPVEVAGYIRVDGSLETAQVVMQVFDGGWKQVGWHTVARGKSGAGWQEFKGRAEFPESARHVLFGLIVNGDGKAWLDDVSVTAKGAAGEAAFAAAPLPVRVDPDDRRLRYVGRFDRSDRRAPRCAWSACAVTVSFRGTAADARLADGGQDRFQVVVDGVDKGALVLKGGEHTYRLADGLPEGRHTITIVKRTEPIFGTTAFLGFGLNEGATALPVRPAERRIEVIGDSISAGYGNEAPNQNERFSPVTENAYMAYGAVAARRLEAEYVCIAWSSRTLWQENSLPEIYDRTLPGREGSRWDFSSWQPHVVVINLGSNDFAGGNPEEEGWVRAYLRFVERVRRNYPDATIYCAVGPLLSDVWSPSGNALSTIRGYLHRIVAESHRNGGRKVRFIEFEMQKGENGFGADWHPSLRTHGIMAEKLAEVLRRDMGW